MQLRNLIFALLFILFSSNAMSQEKKTVKNDGYPLANFALTANAGRNGDLFGEIMQNTGKLGGWLQARGKVEVFIEKGGRDHKFSEFGKKTIIRNFPFVEGVYGKSPLSPVNVTSRAFCPLGVNNVETSALPVLMLELTLGSAKEEVFNLKIPASDATRSAKILFSEGDKVKEPLENDGYMVIPVKLEPGFEKTIRISVAFYDDLWYSAKQFGGAGEISLYAQANWERLYSETEDFSRQIPATGDRKLDEYLRWYMVPGIALTRVTKSGEALTMGYCELNQRDSYWTSWLHLVLYRDLERRMLEESVEWQQPDGKIPTTILPLIERSDDLDINAFFILREARYYRYYRDRESLAADWESVKKAMDWLLSRDKKGNGLPEQVSFWGDWKDVQGVKDRLYSPFSGLIYLSALKEIIFLANELGDVDAVRKYEVFFRKGYDFINKHVSEGGLWNGNYYCQVWKDGSVNDRLLQDQTIGILFGVVPEDRGEAIIKSLNKQSLTPFGTAETYPYYPESFGLKPATYHNGAVWPWLSFMDDWSRITLGKKKEAIRLIKRVAKADLVDSGDWSPNEHINSLTGENLGFILQGWNAGLYGLIYFGVLHNEINITGIPE
ncbi:MAG: glycoside hydrolase family 116 protein [Dysgonamonadaceae bacterium]|nr:glycoside hydrolase family 116 protein [Dysgonamonadaceae bacterium]